MKKKTLSLALALVMVLMVFIPTAAVANGFTYSPSDIAAINSIITNNGLNWTLAPVDGSSIPGDWKISDGYFDSNNVFCITRLAFKNLGLTGTLDISGLTALKELDCNDNKLAGLNVSKNTALTVLHAERNQLTALDVSKNTALTSLSIPSNQLTALDISKNTALTAINAATNKLTALDVSKNTALTSLNVAGNQLTMLDVSKNTALKTLNCYQNQLASLDVSRNTALTFLQCHGNYFSSKAAIIGLDEGKLETLYFDPQKTREAPVFVDRVTVEVPRIPGMTINMSRVFDHYFYRESDGSILFLFGFSDNDQNRGVIFDRDITLKPMPAGLTMWALGYDGDDQDIFFKAGEAIKPSDLIELIGSDLLYHCFTIDGVTVNILSVDQLSPDKFIYGIPADNYSGVAGELAAAGFEMRPISSITAAKVISLDNLTKTKTYTEETFTDIAGQWYTPYIQKAYEYGIINGKGNNKFDPAGNLTGAEALTIGAKIHAIYKYGAAESEAMIQAYKKDGDQWYDMYTAYCKAEGLIGGELDSRLTTPIKRSEMVFAWSKLLQASDMPKKNTVNSLPDVTASMPYYDEIKLFYEAGIISGTDSNGTFKPDNNITRAECATIFMNLIDESGRKSDKTFGS